ncbi:hypothetical protein BH10PLA2_BH10PLA2_30220 [soil metagenome]
MRILLRKAAVLAAMAVVVGMGRADEDKVPLDKLPKAITAAVKTRFPKGELVEAAKETSKDGDKVKVEYEVTVKENGAKIDVILTPGGQITLMEKVIAVKDLPKVVADAIDGQYPKATIKTAEEIIKVTDGKESLDCYEVLLVTADKKTFELKLSVEGKITETEEKKDKD